MDATEIASYAMAVAGLGLVTVGLRGMLTKRVAYRMANAMLLKLTNAGNADRAEKLCKAAPGTYLDAIAAAIAAAKATGSRDLVTLAAASRPAFDATGAKLAVRWRSNVTFGFVGAMLLAGGFALGFDGTNLRMPLIVGGGIAILAAIWIAANRRDLETALTAARTDVLPALEQSLAGTASPPPGVADADKLEKLKRVAMLEDAAAPAPRPSRPAIVEALAAPVANRATSSLRSGACPLCKHTEIRQVERTPGFRTYVCGGCGYTQEFAEL